MYEFELQNRKEFFYPPFSRIIKITLKHKIKEVVDDMAKKLATALQRDLIILLLGLQRQWWAGYRNQYLMELLVKLPLDMKKIEQYKKLITKSF